jgi:crotonobetainyl-CoA:carnitine CoA-transferase CaiB-like acyl-CoA transferase
MGDRNAGMALAFGIAGALVRAGRTGHGSLVDVSLLATAMWTLSSDLLAALRGVRSAAVSRQVNPLFGGYRTKDGRHIQLAFLQPDRYWAELCQELGREELASDARFADAPSPPADPASRETPVGRDDLRRRPQASPHLRRDRMNARTERQGGCGDASQPRAA